MTDTTTPPAETASAAITRNRNGTMVVAVGILLILVSISDDAAKLMTWGQVLSPHEFFGLLGHAAGAALLYLGAKRQDP